jgi:hypothetical protein
MSRLLNSFSISITMMPAVADIMRLKAKIKVQVFKKSKTAHWRFLNPASKTLPNPPHLLSTEGVK